jgi:hypothetical protein
MSGDNGAAPQQEQAIARRPDRTPLSQRNPVALAEHFWKSGYFTDVRSMSQAVVKIVAGEELGYGPMTSMQGIHIIEGKPSLSANLLGALVKGSERYNYRPREVTAEVAIIAFYENGEEIGLSEFTIDQAKAAGLIRAKSGWEKFPAAMLFARAMSQGVRWFCPDVTAGSPAYTPEELGAEVDEQGEPLFVESVAEPTEQAPTGLPPDRIAHLVEGIEILKPHFAENGVTWLDGLNIELGSLGIDGFSPTEEIDPQIAKLTIEQADALDARLSALAEPEEVSGEVVEEVASDA